MNMKNPFVATHPATFAAPETGYDTQREVPGLPETAVIRISRGRFDPVRFAEVDRMIKETGIYLAPAIKRLPGLISYHAGTSPDGFTTQVSIWETEAAGMQMRSLPEMRDRARVAAETLGVVFEPIVQYPVNWSVSP
jgi:hypothetical protein